ncbi:hypothetical protein N7508_011016 [Penicillium antarcticum]|uniref:uncharacterized protein n=1 Tax=Penicillium antarcticum TaxID=416450 RepID=UPI0023841C34|nr:uncharacterized protein N7508_011016 [Penicillium antarcticum]KAJ5296195.1 hypothetical protein N7508_011016 [Penicillium antarcticum]
MRIEVEILHWRIRFIGKQAESLRRRWLMAEEQARRRAELLEDAIQEVDVVRKENNLLTTQLANFQAGMKSFSEEEFCHSIRLLYDDLRHWICLHFGEHGMGKEGHNMQPIDAAHVLTIDGIQSYIARLIFTTFWVRYMVGCEASWNNYLCNLDNIVEELCELKQLDHTYFFVSTDQTRPPSHLVALEKPVELQIQQQRIVNQVEDWFSQYSTTDKLQRTNQLNNLIQRCIQLKQNIECQDGIYILRSSHPRMPFRDQNMRSLMEEAGANETVDYSVWPGLFKILQPGNWSVIEKEIVKTSSSSFNTLSLTTESEGQSEDQLSELQGESCF